MDDPDATAATPETPLEVEVDGPVAVLTLSRPERLNAVSLPLYRALLETLERLVEEGRVRVVILTGRGRAFCVGADLKAHGEGPPSAEDRRRYVETAQAAARRIQTLPLPVVAAVNGHAVGAGLELALCCDLVVVAEEAKLRLPEAALGTFVGGGVSYTLPARVGDLRARELLLLGEFVPGREAPSLGLANRAVPAHEVVPEARKLASTLATRSPRSLRLLKETLELARRAPPEEVLEAEAGALLACMGTEDWAEGIRAFEERRLPDFRER